MSIRREFDPDAMPAWLSSLWPSSRYGPFVIAGVNDDDCAVMKWDSQFVIITTDYLNSSPIAIELGVGGLDVLGRLVVAANLADLLSTGAIPRALLIGVTMHRGSTTEDFKQIMKGIKREADKYGVPVVGGDTKLGRALAVMGVAVGSVQNRQELFLKNAAKPGDTVWVSGPIGACSAAVLGLARGIIPPTQRHWAIRTLTRPSLPIVQSRKAAIAHVGHGGIDVSDGLGEDLYRLCHASGVGVIIDAQNIPVPPRAAAIAAVLDLPAWALAFASGGDFQFIMTTSARCKKFMKELDFHPIGCVVAGHRQLLRLPNGSKRPLPRTGHRDVRNMSFQEEIQCLAREAANA
ncbi:MAG: thiamine-monophosphate kinase [Sedimentisphaerales bacterium]|nr:thiamine-monophosphate kinase [Sedimentisphaerales bacterium]